MSLFNSSYRDFREPSNSSTIGDYTIEFYHVNVARLAFIVVFEVNKVLYYLAKLCCYLPNRFFFIIKHVIFFAVTCLHWIIQDVPTVIKHQVERENSIIQNAIWSKSDITLVNGALLNGLNHRIKDEKTDQNKIT